MNNLITLSDRAIGTEQVQTVNARDLHSFLKVGKDFSTWLKDRIDQYDFVEDQDFVCSPVLGTEGRGGHNRKDYHLTLDMAKELSMVERNDKGKEARQYFIECERKAKTAALSPANLSRMQLIQLAMEAEQEKLLLETKVAEQAPKVEVHDRIAEAAGTYCLRDTASNLQVAQNRFIAWMASDGWIYKRVGTNNWLAYSDKLKAGYLVHKTTVVTDANTGEDKIKEQVRVTASGLLVLAARLATLDAPIGFVPPGRRVMPNARDIVRR